MLQLLRNVIQQNNLTGTPEQIANQLNAKTIEEPVTELYTSTGILMELGPDLTKSILSKFLLAAEQDPLLRSQYEKLNTTGIQLSHPLTLQMLDSLKQQGVFTDADVEAIRSIAFKKKSLWEQVAGEGAVVTVEDVQAALNHQPVVTKQILLSATKNQDGVAITLMVNTLHDGRPFGQSEVYQYRTGGELPSDQNIAGCMVAVRDALVGLNV